MGRKRKQQPGGSSAPLWMWLSTTIIAVGALLLHGIDVRETFFNKPYELTVSVLAFDTYDPEWNDDSFRAELAFSNTGEHEVLFLNTMLMLPMQSYQGYSGTFPSETNGDSGEIEFTLKPGERVTKTFRFPRSPYIDMQTGLATAGPDTVEAHLVMVVLGRSGFERRFPITGLTIRSEDGRVKGSSTHRGVYVFDGEQVAERPAP